MALKSALILLKTNDVSGSQFSELLMWMTHYHALAYPVDCLDYDIYLESYTHALLHMIANKLLPSDEQDLYLTALEKAKNPQTFSEALITYHQAQLPKGCFTLFINASQPNVMANILYELRVELSGKNDVFILQALNAWHLKAINHENQSAQLENMLKAIRILKQFPKNNTVFQKNILHLFRVEDPLTHARTIVDYKSLCTPEDVFDNSYQLRAQLLMCSDPKKVEATLQEKKCKQWFQFFHRHATHETDLPYPPGQDTLWASIK